MVETLVVKTRFINGDVGWLLSAVALPLVISFIIISISILILVL
jgi:hypothetical protein